MKAIVYTGPGQVRVVEDWPEPVCAPDEVVVQMRAVGLCGSDLSVYDGHRDLPSLPCLMGHEGGGELVEVGEQVSDRRVGERVVIEPNLSCLSCPACLSGVTSDCPKRRILGMNAPGVLAERVAVPAAFVLPVPAAWPDQVLACFEPLAVARAAVRRSGVRAGQRCLVVGAGSQGVLLCLALQAVGAQPFVTEPHEGRLAMAERLGAQRAELDGPGFPHVFETAGAPAAFATAVREVASTGTITLIGLTSEPVQLSTSDVVRRGLTLTGSIIYDHPRDFAETRDAVEQGLHPEQAVLEGIEPARAAEAFADARSLPGKSWIDLTRW
jgi:2-desacetyl-2-hydroxyethyl bacteriochlorophyllide A dehydrogenase